MNFCLLLQQLGLRTEEDIPEVEAKLAQMLGAAKVKLVFK